MSDVVNKVVAQVLADAAVQNLIGDRLTPETAGQFDLALPRATYEVIPNESELAMSLGGPEVALVRQTFRFHAYAKTISGEYTATTRSSEIAQAIQQALHGFVDVPVRAAFQDGSVFTGPVPDGADNLAHRIVDITVLSN